MVARPHLSRISSHIPLTPGHLRSHSYQHQRQSHRSPLSRLLTVGFQAPPPPVCRVVCLQLRISVGRGASRRPQHSCFSFLDIELIRALSLSPTLRSKPVFYALQNLIPSWSIKHVTLDSLLTPRMWSTYQAAVFNQVPSLYQFEVTFSFASANDARADLLCPLLFTGEEVPYVSQICPLVSPVLIILPVPARGIQLTVSITA